MKRIFLLLVGIMFMSTAAFASRDVAIAIEQLPKAAQQFIQAHFANMQVSYAKKETDFFDKSYEVMFVNGCKVEFNSKGEWTDVDCKYAEVPTGVIPPRIQAYLTKNYPNVKVVDIEKDKRDYELKLSNRIELKFDRRENLIGYDR